MKVRLSSVLLYVFGAVAAIYLLVPLVIVFPLSFTSLPSFMFPPRGYSTRWYERFLTDPVWVSSLYDSLRIAVITMVVATCAGTAAALGARRLRPAWERVVFVIMLLPAMTPAVALAVGGYMALAKLDLLGTTAGFVVVHASLALPFVFVCVRTSLQAFDPLQETAAASLGARPSATFRQVVLPQIAPGVLGGAVFAFVTSWDEVVIATFISTIDLTTMPVQQYLAVARDTDPTLAAASSLVIAAATLLIIFITWTRDVRGHRD